MRHRCIKCLEYLPVPLDIRTWRAIDHPPEYLIPKQHPELHPIQFNHLLTSCPDDISLCYA